MKIKVTSYILTEQSVIAQIESGDMNCGITIPREEYEAWIAPDGTVDMSFTHHNGDVQTEVPCIVPIADYWLQGEDINDSPVLEHLYLYLTRDEASRLMCKAQLLEADLIDIFDCHLDTLPSARAKTKLYELILACAEAEQLRSAATFKRILNARSL